MTKPLYNKKERNKKPFLSFLILFSFFEKLKLEKNQENKKKMYSV